MSEGLDPETRALKEMVSPDQIQERIDRKKTKVAEFIEEEMYSQAIQELVQMEQLEERKHVIQRIREEELDFSNQQSLPEAR